MRAKEKNIHIINSVVTCRARGHNRCDQSGLFDINNYNNNSFIESDI